MAETAAKSDATLTVQADQPAPTPPAITTPTTPLDETVPGGAYMVGGVWRDSEGREISAPKGK